MARPLSAPFDPSLLLERPRLFPFLEANVPERRLPRVVLITGMTGSGKTVASRFYVERLDLPMAMIELQADADHGWSALRPVLAQLGLPTARPAAALHTIQQPTVLVVDRLEVGLTADGMLDQALAMWLPLALQHPWLHLVLVSRVFPIGSDLIRLAGGGQMHVVDGSALAFTAAEAQALWRQRRNRTLDADTAARLIEQCEGLAGVVALACALGWQPEDGPNLFLHELIRHMLAAVPDHLRDLLVDTSVVEDLTPAAIEALTDRRDGQQVLQELHQWGLLTSTTAPAIHPLVRQSALDRLQRDERRYAAATQRAVTWLCAVDQPVQAWQTATTAKQWDLARSLLLRLAPELRQAGQSRLLIEWIEGLPEAAHDHEVVILLGRCQADIGDLDGAMLTLSALRATSANAAQEREASIWLASIMQARGSMQAADELVQPYLNDPALTPVWQARVLRIHAIARAMAGDSVAAWGYIQRCIQVTHAANERRLLALAYQDQATIAGRMGRLAESEQALRLAERCWRDLQSLPDLAVTLNARAMLALSQRDFATAADAAQQARVSALAGGRIRDAAIASATAGDAAFAVGDYEAAWQHYQVAIDDGHESNYVAVRAYGLALQAHIARLRSDAEQAAMLLPRLLYQRVESPEYVGWLISGIVAAQLTLGVKPEIDGARAALEQIEPELEDVQVALLAMLAQAYWVLGDPDQALVTWTQLEHIETNRHELGYHRLAILAAAEPALLTTVTSTRRSFIAESVLAQRSNLAIDPVVGAFAAEVQPALQIRVFGAAVQVWWHGDPVIVSERALALLILLATAAGPLSAEHLVAALWGEDRVGAHALHKLVVRLRAVMPGVVRRSAESYALTLPRADVDIDLLTFLELDFQTVSTEQLRASADAASAGWLLSHNAPWVRTIREQASRRLGLAWLELGRRAEAEGATNAAHDAFERAQAIDPVSDLIARAVLQHAQRRGDRALLIQRYLRYQQALDLALGVEPATDLQAIYRQALEP